MGTLARHLGEHRRPADGRPRDHRDAGLPRRRTSGPTSRRSTWWSTSASLEDFPTNTMPGFTENLLELLPGLREHSCSRGRRGGFVERLDEGTWLGHVAEHVALQLQQEAGHDIRRGKTRQVKGAAGPLQRHLRVRRREGRPRGRAARRPAGQPPGPGRPRVRLRRTSSRRSSCGPSAPRSARRPRRSWTRPSPATSRGSGSTSTPWCSSARASTPKRIRATMTSETSSIAVDIASDKDLTTRLLGAAGLPVPKSESVRTADQAVTRRQADRLPGRGQAAGRQPRPRRLPQPPGRGRRPRGVPDRLGAVPARLGDRRVVHHRQGLPVPDHRRPDGRDRRAGAGARDRRRHQHRRASWSTSPTPTRAAASATRRC